MKKKFIFFILICLFGQYVNSQKLVTPVCINENWGVIDQNGNWVIHPSGEIINNVNFPTYEYIKRFYCGIALAKMSRGWEYINLKGEVISKDKGYNCSFSFKNNYARVSRHGSWGFIDTSGNYISHINFEHANDFSNGRAAVRYRLKWGFIDTLGNYVVEPTFNLVRDYCEGIAAIYINHKWGYIDLSGNIIIPAIYSDAADFSCGRAMVAKGNHKMYINKKGEVLANTDNYIISSKYSENYAYVKKDSLYGFIDTTGQYMISPQFYKVKDFFNGFAVVQDREKCGYINTKGEIVVPLNYEFCKKCFDSTVIVKHKSEYCFLNLRNGSIIGQNQNFKVYHPFSEGLARVNMNDKWGYINEQGEVVIDFIYDDAKDFHFGIAGVKVGQAWGFIDIKGNVIVKPAYNHFNYSQEIDEEINEEQ